MTTMNMTPENDAKLKILASFVKAFPTPDSTKPDKEGLYMYLVLLRDVSATELQYAMEKQARVSPYYPAVAAIHQEVEKIREAVDPSRHVPAYDEAWDEVFREMKRVGGSTRPPHFSTPAIGDTVRRLGWSCLCAAETRDMGIIRAQFRDLYNVAIKRQQEKQEQQRLLAAMPEEVRLRLASSIRAITERSMA